MCGLSVLLVGAVSLALVGCSRPTRPSVLLITIDTLRADHLGCYGYDGAQTPNIDTLASEGVLFEQVGAQAPVTLPSHATILTGLTPATHGLHDNGTFRLPQEVSTLAELLASRGYRTGAVVGAFVLARCFGLGQGFGHYEDSFAQSGQLGDASHYAQKPASEVAELGIRWVQQQGRDPFFLWLHFFDPHAPYGPPAPFAERFGHSPYDGEIAFVDREVGRVLRGLVDQGLDASTIVALTSDHGEGLGEHGEPDHSHFVYESTLRVPLLVRWPGRLPGNVRVKALARTVDLAPTILELLDVPVPEWMEGASLIPLLHGAESRDMVSVGESLLPLYHFGLSPLVSARTARWKYIGAPRPELYDLREDPGETHNLAELHPDVAADLSSVVARYVSQLSRRESSDARRPVIPDEERRELAALGYVVSAAQPATLPDSWSDLQDPKDHAWRIEMVKRAARLIGRGDTEGGLDLAEQATADGTRIPLVQHLRGWGFFLSGRLDEAAQALGEGMALDSTYVQFPKLLGRVELARGDPVRAAEALDRALVLDPEDPELLRLKAQALLALGLPADALALLEAAYRLQPTLWATQLMLAHGLLALGRPDSALEHARAALAGCPQPAVLHVLMAECHEAKQAWPEAADSYRRALGLDSTMAEAHRRMAWCYHQAGREDTAAILLEEHLRRYGEDSPLLSMVAGLRLAGGDTTGAVEAWQRSVVLDSTNASAWAGLVGVSVAQRDVALARQLASTASRCCPDDTLVPAALRRAEWALGRGAVPRQTR